MTLGVLETGGDRISGWVVHAEAAPLIEIFLDDLLMVKVRADLPRPDVVRVHGAGSGFSFIPAKSLLNEIPPGTAIRARPVGGEFLPTLGGLLFRIGQGEGKRLADLLGDGMQVSAKSGALYRPVGLSEGFGSTVGRAYSRTRESVGYELVAAYGSLLGLIREGRFLSHDDDFDAAFLSPADTYEQLAADFVTAADNLRRSGATVTVFPHGNMHVTFPGLPMIDVFVYGHISGDLVGYQVCAACPLMMPTSEVEYVGTRYAVPADSEAVLTAIYGPNWRVPDPHFQWRPTTAVRESMSRFAAAAMKRLQE